MLAHRADYSSRWRHRHVGNVETDHRRRSPVAQKLNVRREEPRCLSARYEVFPGSRNVAVAGSLNPELQMLETWLAKNKRRNPRT